MQSFNSFGAVVRFIGGVSILAALAFSTGVASAGNPIKVGFIECETGACASVTRTTAQAQVTIIHSIGGKNGPRLLDESTPVRHGDAGNARGPHLEPSSRQRLFRSAPTPARLHPSGCRRCW